MDTHPGLQTPKAAQVLHVPTWPLQSTALEEAPFEAEDCGPTSLAQAYARGPGSSGIYFESWLSDLLFALSLRTVTIMLEQTSLISNPTFARSLPGKPPVPQSSPSWCAQRKSAAGSPSPACSWCVHAEVRTPSA